MTHFSVNVGLVGTGYAAKLRAEALVADPRSHLVTISGRDRERTTAFCQPFGAEPRMDWSELITRPDLDLIVVATVNCDHGAIVKAALQAGKSVVVEYPLSLDVAEAETLVQLARAQGQLLHVEHIELLGGVHRAAIETLPAIGTPFYARYATVNPQHPAPLKWTYQSEQFGFPLMGAVSRLHRLTHLFGPVASVSCQVRYWSHEGFAVPSWTGLPGHFSACLCTAQLSFMSGLIADVVYAKGETFWQASRTLEIQGSQGAIVFEGERGTLIQGDEPQAIETAGRRGLFARDTAMVLDYLEHGTPLYVSLEESLGALRVADAARRSAETGQVAKVASQPVG